MEIKYPINRALMVCSPIKAKLPFHLHLESDLCHHVHMDGHPFVRSPGKSDCQTVTDKCNRTSTFSLINGGRAVWHSKIASQWQRG